MLRIIQQISSGAAKSYYSTADYLTEGKELQGVWRGRGADELGLNGIVHQKQWDALCDNLNPNTGQQLTARQNSQRRVGWDCNFSVPKSVSLLYALTKDQRILDAFSAAVDQTMETMESELAARVRIGGQNTDRITGNGVWGRFIHFTSRPVDGVPDPQLHAHCFLFNSTFDETENRWKAAQIASIKRDGNYFSSLMHSRFAARLTELGIPIERTAKGWRIEGFDEATEQKFSRRTKQIEEAAERMGITNPNEKAGLGAITRDGKNKKLTLDELRTLWLSRLTPDESHIVQQVQHSMHEGSTVAFDPIHAREAIKSAAEHHFERESVVAERKLLTTALNHAVGVATPEMVFEAQRQSDLISGEQNGHKLFTSPLVLEEERRMIQFAREGRGSCDALALDDAIPSRDWLNDGQRKALAHLCNSNDRVISIRGVAGAGKTSLLSEAAEKIRKHGKEIFVFAPSSEASRDVLRKEGFENAETVAFLLASPKAQAAVQDQVIVIDEAGLLGTRTMAKVFDLAKRANARVILSGDRYQHQSVERGTALRLLEEEAGIRSAELTEIIRQKDRYKQAVAYLSQGRVDAGFRTLDNLKWIHEVEDPQTRYDRIAAEYLQATEAGKSVAVIAPTHAEGGRVTQAIRDALQHEGKIGPDQANVLKLTSKKLTVAQRRDSVNYINGDTVIFTQNAKGIRKGTRLEVGIDTIPLDQAERYEVYRQSEIALAKGDLIRVTANAQTADGHCVNNGQVYTVRQIAKDGTVTLNNGWHLGPQFGQIDYGICSTSYAAQGKTKDRVIVAESSESFPAASREQFYVSVSRGRLHCSIYTDDKRGLLDAVSGSGDRISATELTGRRPVMTPQRRHAMQQAVEPYLTPEPVLQREGGRYDR